MAAGLGFKTFTTGDVLTAGDTNGYLMQGVWVFADDAARTAAVTSPQEGNMSFLKDTNATEYYDGSAWVAVAAAGGGVNPNLVINGNFTVNQRSYVSASSLSSGTYGFDRWKSNAAGTTLTFTSAPYGQTVTINSTGGITQIVEQANVGAGTYVLSWSGTATARIYNVGATPPSYAASPVTFTADGLANVQIDFTADGGTKTCGLIKLEIGSTPTNFVFAGNTIQGELAACQRYYWRLTFDGNTRRFGVGLVTTTTNGQIVIPYPVTMRIRPTALEQSGTAGDYSVFAGTNVTCNAVPTYQTATQVQGVIDMPVASGLTVPYVAQGRNVNTNAFLGWSAEL